jgi:hypothetical protein
MLGRLILSLAGVALSILIGSAAQAALLIEIDKSTQQMTVTFNDERLYTWPVSTGTEEYDTPTGTFAPFRMEIDHRSDEWDNAPMPYSIFFTDTGVAVHGTYERRSLGRAVSHGCVRLSVKNAATLWKLVKQEKMANTSIVVTGDVSDEAPSRGTRSPPLPSPRYRLHAAKPLGASASNPSTVHFGTSQILSLPPSYHAKNGDGEPVTMWHRHLARNAMLSYRRDVRP